MLNVLSHEMTMRWKNQTSEWKEPLEKTEDPGTWSYTVYKDLFIHLYDPSIHPSTISTISINQSICWSIHPSFCQSNNQWINLSINQPTNHIISQPITYSKICTHSDLIILLPNGWTAHGTPLSGSWSGARRLSQAAAARDHNCTRSRRAPMPPSAAAAAAFCWHMAAGSDESRLKHTEITPYSRIKRK